MQFLICIFPEDKLTYYFLNDGYSFPDLLLCIYSLSLSKANEISLEYRITIYLLYSNILYTVQVNLLLCVTHPYMTWENVAVHKFLLLIALSNICLLTFKFNANHLFIFNPFFICCFDSIKFLKFLSLSVTPCVLVASSSCLSFQSLFHYPFSLAY